MTAIADNAVPASELYSRIYNLKAVKNIVIEIEMLDYALVPLNGGTRICGYGDVSSNSNSVITVSWRTTPIAEVIGKLIDDGFEAVQDFNPENLQLSVNRKIESGCNPLSVNYKLIAEMIKSDISYSVADILPAAEIKGSIIPAKESALVIINEPFGAASETDKYGNFIISNVSAGIWTITSSEGGSVNVTVNNDGTVIPETVQIVSGTNPPAIYKWGIISFNNKGDYETVFTGHAGDLDGLDDIVSIRITSGDGMVDVSLSDNGNGKFIDTVSDDGKFEHRLSGEITNGSFSIFVSDSKSTESQSRTFSFTSLSIPEINYPEPGITVNSRTPLIKWDSVAGAGSYNLYIYNGNSIIYEAAGIKDISHQMPDERPLPDGEYVLHLYACSSFNTYSGSVSLAEVPFRVAGVVNPSISIGRLSGVYYQGNDFNGNPLIRRFDMYDNSITDFLSCGISDELAICGMSPDLQTILYTVNGALYRKRVNTTGCFMVAEKAGEKIVAAEWSPDGGRIAYVLEKDGKTLLFIINNNGSGEKYIDSVLTKNHMEFSNDGLRLYYINSRNSLNSVNADSAELQQIYTVSAAGANMLLSPDGSRILYGGATVSVIKTDGTGLISFSTGSSASRICWTRDNRVVYGKFNTAKTSLSLVVCNPADGIKETLAVFNTVKNPYIYNLYSGPFNYIYVLLGSDGRIVKLNYKDVNDISNIMYDSDFSWNGAAVFAHVSSGGG